jgi:6-phosphofructokinase 2
MIATVTLNPSLDEWMTLSSLAVGELNRADSFARYPGGKGINVSRVAHELRAPTRAYALAGGTDGHILEAAMRRLAIPHDFVTVPGATRNNYKILTRRPRALTEINLPGPRAPASALADLYRRIVRRRRRLRCVVLSGSLPPGAPKGIYARWIRGLRAAGLPCVLDSSGSALRLGVRARPWLIKPNRKEAEELTGRPLSTRAAIVEAMRGLLERGPSVVVVSLAAEGALMASRDGVWFAAAPRVTTDSAVGAGDSLVAGMAVASMRRWPLEEAFRLGIACGTATAMTPGTELCRRGDVERLRRRVTIRRLR